MFKKNLEEKQEQSEDMNRQNSLETRGLGGQRETIICKVYM